MDHILDTQLQSVEQIVMKTEERKELITSRSKNRIMLRKSDNYSDS